MSCSYAELDILYSLIGDNKLILKILDWIGIDEFKRDRPPPKRLAVADSFDEYGQDDYINSDYTDF